VGTGRSCYPVFSVSVGPARRFTLSLQIACTDLANILSQNDFWR